MAENKPSLFRDVINNPISFIVTLIVGIVIFQALAYLVSFAYPPAGQIKLGWVILLLAMAISVWGATIILRSRFYENRAFSRGDVFVIIIVAAAMVAVFAYVPDMLPQVFSVAGQQIQSIVGFPLG